MEKSLIQNIINKYHLGGKIESTKWEVTDEQLSINFSPSTKDMIGILTHNKVPLNDSIICIANTSQLNKLLSILDKDITIEQPNQNNIVISDTNFNIEYSLANPLIIPKSGDIKEPPTYEIEIDLSISDIENIIKSKNALPDEDNLEIISKDKSLKSIELAFGSSSSYSNKIKYSIKGEHTLPTPTKIPFNSDMIKEILVANKTPSSAKMSINSKGLMKLHFIYEEMEVKYYVIRKSNI